MTKKSTEGTFFTELRAKVTWNNAVIDHTSWYSSSNSQQQTMRES
jgi:hypothetical protein